MPRFAERDLQTIRDSVRIEDLIGESVVLKRSGTRLKGLCPFHSEKTASFSVTPAEGMFYCYGCGTGGDIFTFVKEIEKCDFPTAVRHLADRSGVTLSEVEDDPAYAARQQQRKKLLHACETAADLFTRALNSPDAEPARRELISRGLDAADAAAHRCGYAPGSGHAVAAALAEAGIDRKTAEEAGLIGQQGRDFFRNRLIWPITDVTGHTVGFAARRLSDSDRGGKYINSPATPIYVKSRLLYRLDRARKTAAKTGRLYVVEGYTDVMACEKAGLAAVATCGTAFTDDHIRQLQRHLSPDCRIAFALDPDAAGIDATVKIWKHAQHLLDRCEAVRLPGDDPCALAAAGADLAAVMADTAPLTQIVLDAVISAELGDQPTPEARSRAVTAAALLLDEATNPVVADGYRDYAARLIGVTTDALPPVAEPQQDEPHTLGADRADVERRYWQALLLSGRRPDRLPPLAWFSTAASHTLHGLVAAAESSPDWVRRVYDAAPAEMQPAVAGLLAADPDGEDPEGLLFRLEVAHLNRVIAACDQQLARPDCPASDRMKYAARWQEATARRASLGF